MRGKIGDAITGTAKELKMAEKRGGGREKRVSEEQGKGQNSYCGHTSTALPNSLLRTLRLCSVRLLLECERSEQVLDAVEKRVLSTR